MRQHGPDAFPTTELGQGSYRIGPIAPGDYQLSVIDDLNPPVGAQPEGASAWVQVKAGQTRSVALVLDRGGTLHGRVVDQAGEPQPDVWVQLEVEESGMLAPIGSRAIRPPSSRRLTDGAGEFIFADLLPSASFTLRADTADGSDTAVQRGLRPGSQVSLVLQSSGTLRGQVVAADGKPAESFVLEWKERDGAQRYKAKFSRAGGKFELEHVTPGALELRALDISAESNRIELALAPGQKVDGITLQLVSRQIEPEPAGPTPPPPAL